MSALNSLTSKEIKVWFKIANITEKITDICNGAINEEYRQELIKLKDKLYEALDILEDK